MVYSSALLTAEENSRLAADNPLMGEVTGYAGLSTGQWVADGGDLQDADLTDTVGIVSRAFDGFSHLQTFPNAASTPVRDLVLDFGSGTEIEFDTICFLNNNFDSIGISDVQIDIADDDLLALNLVTVANFDPSTTLTNGDRRFSLLTLTHSGGARRYSNVQFVGIRLTAAGSVLPRVGEILFVRRRMLARKSNRPYDRFNQESAIRRNVTRGGVIQDFVDYKGRQRIQFSFMTDTDADSALLTDSFEGAGNGTEPLVWIEDPSTAPHDFLSTKWSEPIMQQPFDGPTERNTVLELVEQGPFYLSSEPDV